MLKASEITIPRHIGIIMDGNGRWAKKRGLPRSAGHLKGAEVFKTIARYCGKIGVEAVTFYAFSTENWSRPKSEVDSIMALLDKYLDDFYDFIDDDFKIIFLGDREPLSESLKKKMHNIERDSKTRSGVIINVAINYGGRDEIVRAARKACEMALGGSISADSIDEPLFNSLLDTAASPPVDLILRPSGEERISNFLLWQSAYSEFVYLDTLWPDFTSAELDRAIEEYSKRKRRFGGV